MATTDSQGIPIKAGDRVAYNQSGRVVPGTVLEVKDQQRVNAWYVKDDVRIAGEDGSISRVRNGDAILVLP